MAAATEAITSGPAYQSSEPRKHTQSPVTWSSALFQALNTPESGLDSQYPIRASLRLRVSMVESVDPPSITTTSTCGYVCSAMLSSARWRPDPPLSVAMTTETVGGRTAVSSGASTGRASDAVLVIGRPIPWLRQSAGHGGYPPPHGPIVRPRTARRGPR